jgi:DNA mismatch repair protein MutS2
LEHLSKTRATALATTHFDSLKTRALGDDAFENVSVGFDVETMKPTFELYQGTPGTSSALSVARRFGAPEQVVERARGLMSGESRNLESAIQALETERRRLLKERTDLEEARRHAEALEKKRLKEIAMLKAREEKFIDEEREALWTEIRLAREKVRDAERTVKRHRRDAKMVGKSRSAINEVAEKLGPGGELAAEPKEELPGTPAQPDDIVEGVKVFVTCFGKQGVVASEPRGKSVFVTVGSLKTKVKLDDLRVLENKEGLPKPQNLQSLAQTRREDPIQTSTNTLDLRGMLSEEAVEATDAFLDKAMKDDYGVAFIIHGHGTGALKTAVRSYVAESPYVADSRPGQRGEGGDGVTVIWVI